MSKSNQCRLKVFIFRGKGKGSNTEATFGIFFPGLHLHVLLNPKHWQEGAQGQAEGPDSHSQSEKSAQSWRGGIQESVPGPLSRNRVRAQGHRAPQWVKAPAVQHHALPR